MGLTKTLLPQIPKMGGLAAYRVALNEGVTLEDGTKTKGDHDASVKFAKQIIYDSHFLYGKANLPELMRGGDIQKIMRSAYTFRSFTHNYLHAMAHLLKNQGWEGKKAFARSLRNLFLMGGLTSIPFFKAFSEALLWAIGDDDEDALTKARAMMPSEWMKDLVVYGLPGVVGVDFTGSLSIEVPRSWIDIFGVPYSTFYEDPTNTIRSLRSGAKFRALSETPFTPLSVRNAMRGIDLYVTGQRTRGGRDITFYGQQGPRKISAKEAIGKGVVGLQPTSVSSGYKAHRAIKKMEQSLKERKRRWADRYVNAYRKGDGEGKEKVLEEIRQWNQKAREEGKSHLYVSNIKRMIQSRLGSGYQYLPKQMRGRAKEISEQWGAR